MPTRQRGASTAERCQAYGAHHASGPAGAARPAAAGAAAGPNAAAAAAGATAVAALGTPGDHPQQAMQQQAVPNGYPPQPGGGYPTAMSAPMQRPSSAQQAHPAGDAQQQQQQQQAMLQQQHQHAAAHQQQRSAAAQRLPASKWRHDARGRRDAPWARAASTHAASPGPAPPAAGHGHAAWHGAPAGPAPPSWSLARQPRPRRPRDDAEREQPGQPPQVMGMTMGTMAACP